MNKLILITTIVLIFGNLTKAQNKDTIINWLSLEEAQKKFVKKQKPIIVYFYSENSDSCNLMTNDTFGNKEVANYINILFYPIKINVNTKDSLKFFDGKYYKYSKKKKAHSFVTKMLGQNYTVPSMILFNKKAQGTLFAAYKSRDLIFPNLIYYSEQVDKSVEYEEFEKYYFKSYPPGQRQTMSRVNVKWKKTEEAIKSSLKDKKYIFLFFYYNYSVSSTVMSLKTFNNPKIAKYLNSAYNPVYISVTTKDTISAFGKKYVNKNKSHKFHQMPIDMLNGKMVFPAYLIISTEEIVKDGKKQKTFKLLDRVQLYKTPEQMEAILYYFAENKYKTMSWNDYISKFKSKMFVEKK